MRGVSLIVSLLGITCAYGQGKSDLFIKLNLLYAGFSITLTDSFECLPVCTYIYEPSLRRFSSFTLIKRLNICL